MSTKITTGRNTRFSYLNVFEPKSINGSNPKYSVSLIIPKDDVETVNKIKSAIKEAYDEGQSKLKGNGKSVLSIKAIKTPLRDGDLERPDDEAYANAYFINANSPQKPGVYDCRKNEITDENEVYSGCFGRASVSFYAYNAQGNKGIACGLNAIQKLKNGEPLGGKGNSADDFDIEDEEDDDDIL